MLTRIWRHLRRAYVLACAREDAVRLGVRIPDGVWFCPPCRAAMLDGLEMLFHGSCAG